MGSDRDCSPYLDRCNYIKVALRRFLFGRQQLSLTTVSNTVALWSATVAQTVVAPDRYLY